MNRWALLRVGMLGLVAGVILIGPQSLVARTGDLLPTGPAGLSGFGNGRGLFWQAVVRAYAGLPPVRWLVGGGYGFTIQADFEALGFRIVAHNEYLWLLADTGLVGLMLYGVFALGVWRRLRGWLRGHPDPSWMRAGVFAGLIMFLVYTLLVGIAWGYTGSTSGTWFYLALLGAALGMTRPTAPQGFAR